MDIFDVGISVDWLAEHFVTNLALERLKPNVHSVKMSLQLPCLSKHFATVTAHVCLQFIVHSFDMSV